MSTHRPARGQPRGQILPPPADLPVEILAPEGHFFLPWSDEADAWTSPAQAVSAGWARRHSDTLPPKPLPS
ncbi:MAG: hypothetical protein H7831_04445 [Magnetococcus sp. WYHC-3]